jgi:predicted flap endonuclease-1-like 5' DNA nuclease
MESIIGGDYLSAAQLQSTGPGLGLSDWAWVVLFIVVVVIVWVLLAMNTRQSEKEQESLEQQVESEAEETEHETDHSEVDPPTPEESEKVRQPALFEAGEVQEEAEQAEPDDLKKIEGIGPKVQSILAENGIQTFKQLENADPENLKRVLKEQGLSMIDPASWHEQASLAAAGDLDGLEKLQEQLTAGRK